jgi:hypothetical protein
MLSDELPLRFSDGDGVSASRAALIASSSHAPLLDRLSARASAGDVAR